MLHTDGTTSCMLVILVVMVICVEAGTTRLPRTLLPGTRLYLDPYSGYLSHSGPRAVFV